MFCYGAPWAVGSAGPLGLLLDSEQTKSRSTFTARLETARISLLFREAFR